MREIKFRVWTGKKMISLADYGKGDYLSIGLTWEAREHNDKEICSNYTKGAVLMQFTGLKDKNGEGN